MKEEKTKTHVIESEEFLKKIASASDMGVCLVLIEGKPLGKKFPLVSPQVRLGRGKKADLTIEDKSISGLHAEFFFKGDKAYVKDLKSTNGTFVNDKRIEESVALSEGDNIRLGTTIFKYIPAGNIENVYHEKMRDLATIDSLTQVYNKKHIVDYLNSEFNRCQSLGIPLPVIMFDIDYFKKFNDKYGHVAGDYVLKKCCALLKDKVLRSEDFFGRYGGEEFILILPETTLQKACEVAERLRQTLEQYPFEYDKNKFKVTISLGVSELEATTPSPEDLIKKADAALYKAKNSGRNQVCVL